ncbi:hypothetical protein QO009_004186 [Brevibacillus aydinogluensis]|jgi:hypothetical protein|uniref:hypothetical protein n=1 Tax=Brevibacillus aydinogluensis TaxID=927786 RepID=UPI0028934D0D|nr:hypothetical protein [Brevibacillus aydinogluensis]MDT3418252.1 hypothetical protein [Brevibacillus aydinogluensis]
MVKGILQKLLMVAQGGAVEGQENQLKWDNIMTFAVVALFLWILVQTSPNAKTLATTLIQQVQTSISNLFSSIGSL